MKAGYFQILSSLLLLFSGKLIGSPADSPTEKTINVSGSPTATRSIEGEELPPPSLLIHKGILWERFLQIASEPIF